MRCSKCGSDNREGRKFCTRCGTPLLAACPKCGAAIEPGERFCGECGTAIGASAPRVQSNAEPTSVQLRDAIPAVEVIDGERKTVTALFADIKGSMELMEALDPEEARAIIDPALKLMIEAVCSYGGHIIQSTGDGIFALFGAPVAHEDHPQRALYAALRMQDAMRRYSAKLRQAGQLPIEARVGVNTGEVVVRSIATGDGHAEYTPIGHSTSLAARMQALAPTGSIAATDTTRRLCEGYFTFKSLGPVPVKGVSAPVEVHEVTGVGPLRTRLQRAAARGLTKFVGRDREIDALRHAAELARAGHGQVVAAVAEPGVGKSRLFYEFKLISQSGGMILEAFSVSHGKATAYLPVIELLHSYFGIGSGDDTQKRREKVAGKVLMLDRSLEEGLPYLFAVLGLSEDGDETAEAGPELRRRRIREAIRRLLLRESFRQPLILIFEDLHWIDGETQVLLNLLVDAIANAGILLLVNYRPEYRHDWGGRTHYSQLRLDPLGYANADEMLSSLMGDQAELAPLKKLIIERSEGNPFFMEEIFQSLLEDGALVRNGRIALTRPLVELRIPLTVQAILSARIDRLSTVRKELLQTMAVIGTEVDLALIKEVARRTEEQLEPILADLQLSDFIYEQPSVAGTSYAFKHALTREVAYGSVLADRRRTVHELTAHAVERLYIHQLDEHYADLAHHYLQGNDTAKAIQYGQLAARQAVDRGAYREAAAVIEPALKILEKSTEDPQQMRGELALRGIQTTVERALHGMASPENERVVHRMCEVAERTGEDEQLLRALFVFSTLLFVKGEAITGLQTARRCIKIAESVGDARLLADAHHRAATLASQCGELRKALAHFEAASRYCRLTDQTISTFGFSFRVLLSSGSSLNFQYLGHTGAAARLAEEGLRHARESRRLFDLGFMLTAMLGHLHCQRREPQILRRHAEEGIALSEENGFAEWLCFGRFFRGWSLTELGQLGEGVAEMQAAIAASQSMGGQASQPYFNALFAYSYASMARTDEALAVLDRALANIARSGEILHQAEVLRLKGEVLLIRDRSRIAEAEKCFRDALKVARVQEAKWWELRSSVSLARLLSDSNRRDEARTMLAAIYNWFTEGFELPDLKDAKGLLDELAD